LVANDLSQYDQSEFDSALDAQNSIRPRMPNELPRRNDNSHQKNNNKEDIRMTNIQSPDFAAKIYQIITPLNNDINLKKQFISDPKKFLAQNQIIIDDAEIIVEDNPGYGLYFEIKNTSSSNHVSNSADNTTQETFAHHHFSDCLHY
jgi:hypothetical protein